MVCQHIPFSPSKSCSFFFYFLKDVLPVFFFATILLLLPEVLNNQALYWLLASNAGGTRGYPLSLLLSFNSA